MSGKEEYIERLFASIAPRYDLVNSVLSLGMHKRWRRFAAAQCGLAPGGSAIDVAAGTLDLSIELSRLVGPEGRVVAVDFCAPMLDLGRAKLAKRGIENIETVHGNAESLPDGCFDAATIGFALRNVESVDRTLSEMARVVRPGGRVISLELARPEHPLLARFYDAYSRLVPVVGGLMRKREPYEYLPASIARFHSRRELAGLMERAGLSDIRIYDLAGGAATVHVGTK
ncbi:MAG: class I SAM-dependent methyltransferase [Armatimonadota bacterium]